MAAPTLLPRYGRPSERFSHVFTRSDRGSKRGRQKTVTWPADEKICEVRHFLVDDLPALLGPSVQSKHGSPVSILVEKFETFPGYRQNSEKRARVESNEDLEDTPPGFSYPVPNVEAIPTATMTTGLCWHGPPKFILEASWLVARGEESREVMSEQQREIRVFEAFYPRSASVPNSPAEPQENCEDIDDITVHQIPLIPIEEEEMDSEKTKQEGKTNVVAELAKCQQADLMSIADPNLAAAAAAACMIVRSLGESDLVDQALLVEILKNPSMLKSLTSANQVSKDKSQNHSTKVCVEEPMTSLPGKSVTNHDTHMNGSPVSESSKLCEGARSRLPSNVMPITSELTKAPRTTRSTPDILHNSPFLGRFFMHQGVESTSSATPCSELSIQKPCIVQACRPENETRSVSSISGGLKSEQRSTTHSMQAMAPVVVTSRSLFGNPSSSPFTKSSVVSVTSSPNPFPMQCSWRISSQGAVPPRRVVEDKILQTKTTALGSVPHKTGGRPKRLCMYYNSPKGCHNGGECAFVHQSPNFKMNAMAQ